MITANGFPVVRGELTLPYEGRWTASLIVDTDTALASPVEILDSDSDFRAVGAVRRGLVYLDAEPVLLVGGAGGLLEAVSARSYRAVPARLVVTQLLAETGEVFADDSDAAILATLLPHWARATGIARHALGRVVTRLGAQWRVRLDGQVWVGRDAWPVVELDEEALEEHPAAGRALFGAEALDPAIVPGVLLLDRRVSTVTWSISPERTRCEVTFLDG